MGEYKKSWAFKQLETIAQRYKFDLSDAIEKIPEEAMNVILNGGKESFEVDSKSLGVKDNIKLITRVFPTSSKPNTKKPTPLP